VEDTSVEEEESSVVGLAALEDTAVVGLVVEPASVVEKEPDDIAVELADVEDTSVVGHAVELASVVQ
jgi:pyruvoyl-dependent arginine decarboxylase (PvlArgDC)